MKYRKSSIIIFILIFYFCFLLQKNNMIFYEYDNKNNRNTPPILSASNATAYEWDLTWGGSSNDYGRGVAVDSSGNI